jgi:hypothetical protein
MSVRERATQFENQSTAFLKPFKTELNKASQNRFDDREIDVLDGQHVQSPSAAASRNGGQNYDGDRQHAFSVADATGHREQQVVGHQSSKTLPPRVPNMPSAVLERFKSWESAIKFPSFTSQTGHSDSANNLEFPLEGHTRIVMNDNEEVDNSSESPNSSALHAKLQASSALVKGTPEPSENFWESIQKQTKSLSPEEVGRKLTESFNPLVSFAKTNVEKTVLAAKPALATAGRGFESVQSSVKSTIDKTGVPKAFQRTQDDFADLTSRVAVLYNGDTSICSKCQKLPVDLLLSGSQPDVSQCELNWASPLSRIIYHAEWCKMCQLLLDMLCLPIHDPMRQPAVASHVQPELTGLTMQEWVSKGWKYTDENWPFGHGNQRHEGASYVLGPAGDTLGKALKRTILLTTAIHQNRSSRQPKRETEIMRNHRQRHRLEDAKKPPQYPLSCLVNISTLGNQSPGLLMVKLVGYGRKLGAELEVLSSFRLRASSPNPVDSVVLQLPKPNTSLSYGRILNRDWIDPSIGRLWLSECEQNHGSACREQGWDFTMRKPLFLRVIDVEDFCIKEIDTSDSCRYVALSYVWGSAAMVKLLQKNREELMVKNSLLRRSRILPRTVVGAIEVVKAIGERYLWNDALCIVQNDGDEVKEHISFMDAIYGSAVATIISADGSNANAGLEGIQLNHWGKMAQNSGLAPVEPPGRPRSQNALQGYKTAMFSENLSIAAPLDTVDHNLSRSVWNSRAWTFQERLLSRRLIIFSHGHITWHCRGMICREDMTVEDSGVKYNSLQWLSLDPRAGDKPRQGVFFDDSTERTRHGTTRLVRSTRFAEYVKAVEEYTHRQMSHQTDALNAFAGLGRIFSMALQSESYYGLPVRNLDVGLLWRPTHPLIRRSGFPSWSWAGWIGQVAYSPTYELKRRADGTFLSFEENTYGEEGIRPLIRWSVLGTPPPRDLMTTRESNGVVELINGTGLGFPYDSGTLPKEWENGPWHTSADNAIGEPRSAPLVPSNVFSNRSPGNIGQQLIFWASCTTKLLLGASIDQQSAQVKAETSQPPLRHWIIDEESYAVGNVILDSGDNKAWLEERRYGFVQTAEAQYSGLGDEERDVEDFPLYVVMLVIWDEQRQVAERRGIGRVSKEAWKLTMPKMKLVRLQ